MEKYGQLHFLFLQGLPCPFFTRVAAKLAEQGCEVGAINFCAGDQLFWRGPNAVNFRGRPAEWRAFIARYLDQRSVTDIVMLGEQRSYHKVAIEEAKRRGVRITVTDFGYLRPDWITLERDGMGGNSLFPRDARAILALGNSAPQADLSMRYSDSFWTMAISDMVYHLANLVLFPLFPHYRRPYRRDPAILHYLSIGRRLLFSRAEHRNAMQRLTSLQAANAPYFLFPLQLENDFQILAYSPFRSLDEAVKLVLESFAAHAPGDVRLIVKVHPLEPGIRGWRNIVTGHARRLGVTARVEYFDGGDLDSIIRGANGVVTVNSTTGIRALQLGKPVKVLGTAIFDLPGLTFQGDLSKYWKDAKAPDAELTEAFIDAIAATIHVRGVFYSEPGLSSAVDQASDRLLRDEVGVRA